MYFIRDINELVENNKDLEDFIDPVSLKDGSDLMKYILKKLFELRESNSGTEKIIINILIKDWLGYIYFGCVSKIYQKKSKKKLDFYYFKHDKPNIDFFNNYKPSNFKSLKRSIYRFFKQFINNKNIIVKNLDHNSIIEELADLMSCGIIGDIPENKLQNSFEILIKYGQKNIAGKDYIYEILKRSQEIYNEEIK